MKFLKSIFPGIILVSIIVFISTVVSSYVLIGSVAIAIIIGMLTNQFIPINDSFNKGIKFSEKQLLSIAIILLGSTLDASILKSIDLITVGLLAFLICTSISVSLIVGKLLKLSNSLSLLLGIGNGICGSSAIAGASQVIEADENDIGISIAIINILGAIGIFFVPFMISSFFSGNFYDQGVIVGGTIQAVGQVTAAGFIMGDEVGEVATLIKMIRILMLGPVLIILSLFYKRKDQIKNKRFSLSIPPFIIGFFVLFILANYNLIPILLLPYLEVLSKYCLLFAMAAIGLNISLKSIFNKGYKAVLLSSTTFVFQVVLIIYILGN